MSHSAKGYPRLLIAGVMIHEVHDTTTSAMVEMDAKLVKFFIKFKTT